MDVMVFDGVDGELIAAVQLVYAWTINYDEILGLR